MKEVRKTFKSKGQAKIAVEKISLGLSTVREIEDIPVTLAPAMSVINSVRGSLSNIIPRADQEFNSISDTLSSILVDAGQMGGIALNFSTANAEANRILMEAERQVERDEAETHSCPRDWDLGCLEEPS